MRRIIYLLALLSAAAIVSSGAKIIELKEDQLQEENIVNVPQINNERCQICKIFVDEMFKFMRSNQTEEKIRDGLSYICRIVPEQQKEQCKSLVFAYSKEIVEILLDETDPKLICTLLEQCVYPEDSTTTTTTTTTALPVLKQAEPISISEFINMLEPNQPNQKVFACVECKLFVKYLQNEFNDSVTQEELKDWLLTNLCGSLGDQQVRETCNRMVEDKSPAFFKAITQQLEPKQVCQELKACPNRLLSLVLNAAPERPLFDLIPVEQLLRPKVIQPEVMSNNNRKDAPCDLCQDIVRRLDEYLSTNEIEHDIDTLVTQVCAKIPLDSYRKSCTKLVKTFGQEIISLIEIMDNPHDLCTKITLC